MCWQVVAVRLLLFHIDSLASRIKKVDVEANLLPRNGAVILNRPNHPDGRTGPGIAEDNLTIQDCDLAFVVLVVLAPIKHARKKDEKCNHGETGKDHPEGRMEYNHRGSVLKVLTKGTFSGILWNLHATHLACLLVRIDTHWFAPSHAEEVIRMARNPQKNSATKPKSHCAFFNVGE